MATNKAIANSWEEMTIERWQDIQEILSEEGTDAVDKNVKLVGYMYDIPDEDAYNLPLDDFSKALDGIGWLGSEPVIPEPSDTYLINNKKYTVCLNQREITTAQYIDFRAFNTDVPKNIHLILSILMVPEGHRYNDGYDIEQVQRDIQQYMRITHALSLVRFFFQLYVALTTNSLRSLMKTLRRKMKRTRDKEKLEDLEKKLRATEELERMFGSLA